MFKTSLKVFSIIGFFTSLYVITIWLYTLQLISKSMIYYVGNQDGMNYLGRENIELKIYDSCIAFSMLLTNQQVIIFIIAIIVIVCLIEYLSPHIKLDANRYKRLKPTRENIKQSRFFHHVKIFYLRFKSPIIFITTIFGIYFMYSCIFLFNVNGLIKILTKPLATAHPEYCEVLASSNHQLEQIIKINNNTVIKWTYDGLQIAQMYNPKETYYPNKLTESMRQELIHLYCK